MITSAQNSAESHSSGLDDIENAVQVYSENFHNHKRKGSCASGNLFVYPNNRLCNIVEAHCSALPKSFRNYKYDYARDIIAVYFLLSVNPEDVTSAIFVHIIHGKKLLSEGNLWLCLIGAIDNVLWRYYGTQFA